MENTGSRTEDRAQGYEKAFEDMLRFREEFLKLTKEEQDRLLREALPVWFPNVDPFKAKLILGGIGKLIK